MKMTIFDSTGKDPGHIPDKQFLDFVTNDPDETRTFGRHLALLAEPGDLFLLFGELGVGKTTLTQGILWGLGSDEYVTSPTFVLVSEYQARIKLNHIDLFRLDHRDKMFEMGLEEYIESDGLNVIEWPNQITDLLSYPHLNIRIERLSKNSRRILITTTDVRYQRFMVPVILSA